MADNRFIYAEVGGGKSYFATTEIIRELERTERFVVTNIPLCLDYNEDEENAAKVKFAALYREKPSLVLSTLDWDFLSLNDHIPLQVWCQKWIEKPVDVSKRVAVLTKEQATEFWRYLPLGALTAEQIKEFNLTVIDNDTGHGICRVVRLPDRDDPVYGKLTDFSARNRKTGCIEHGVHYFIDEAHTLFSARNFQKTSPGLENYQSQLRKLDDDLALISQHPEKVDKNARRNATEWLRIQNMKRTILPGGVTLPGQRFRLHYFPQTHMPDKNDKPQSVTWVSFEKRKMYHKLYYTMDGVGVSGGLVKESTRRTGRSPVVWLAFLVVLIAVAWKAPVAIEYAIQHVVSGSLGSVQKGAMQGLGFDKVAPPSKPVVVPPPPAAPSSVPTFSGPTLAAARPEGVGLFCKGWMPVGTNRWFILSDGSYLKTEFGDVKSYGARWLLASDGRKIPVRNAN